MKEPVAIIELDLPYVMKQSYWLTGSFVLLSSLYYLWHINWQFSFSWKTLVFVLLGYGLFIILHECCHLLGFRIFGGVPWKKMQYGLNLKLGVAYATTDQLIINRSIRKALLLPFWLTGMLPFLYGIVFIEIEWLLIGSLLIGGAAGDFAMYKELKKLPDDYLVQDHPELPRLTIFSPTPN